jgi:pyruvate-formate lyase
VRIRLLLILLNVVDKAILLDAQAHPEKHTNLMVRVAGYSAYFVDLAKALRDDVIREVEQGF